MSNARARRSVAGVALAAGIALAPGAAGAQAEPEPTPEEELGTGRTFLSAGLALTIASGGVLGAGITGIAACRSDGCVVPIWASLLGGGFALLVGTQGILSGALMRRHALARGARGRPVENHPTLLAPGVAMVVTGLSTAALGAYLLFPHPPFGEAVGSVSGSGSARSRDTSYDVPGAMVIGTGAGLLATGVGLIVLGARGDRVPGPRVPALGFGMPGVGAPGVALGWRF